MKHTQTSHMQKSTTEVVFWFKSNAQVYYDRIEHVNVYRDIFLNERKHSNATPKMVYYTTKLKFGVLIFTYIKREAQEIIS